MSDREIGVAKVEQLLLRWALLILLAVGLLKVLVPEVLALRDCFRSRTEVHASQPRTTVQAGF